MRIGIFAKTFPGKDPASVLAASAASGFAGVQYNMACSGLEPLPDNLPAAAIRAVARAAAAHRQTIFALSATWNMAHPDSALRTEGLRRFEGLARAGRAMGTRILTLCTGSRDAEDQWRHHPDNASPQAWADMRASLDGALDLAETHDLLLAVEPELANVVDSATAARRLIDQAGSDRLRIVLDPANLFEQASPARQRYLVEQAVDLLADRIVLAHAKDRAPDGSFVTAGSGVIDFDHFLRGLQAAGFAGPVVTHGLTAAEAPRVARFLTGIVAGIVAG